MLKKTYTILAVALTATVTACGGAAEPEPDASEGQLSGGQVEQEQEQEPKAACDAEALNEELSLTSLDEAVANRARFRCLCDDEGYPLVGNINGKAVSTASKFCGALREKDLL
jgi:hypothetical protein